MAKKTNSKKDFICTEWDFILSHFGFCPCKSEVLFAEKGREDDSDLMETACDVQSYFPYKKIVLTVYPRGLSMSEEEMKETLIHEAGHVLLAELEYLYSKDACEAALEAARETICEKLSLFVATYQ